MSSRPPLPWRIWEIAALAVLTAVGIWLRLEHLDRGIIGDEIGLLQYRGVDRILRDSLNTLHPPLFRMSFRSILDPTAAVEVGRQWSFLCGVASIIVLTGLTRRVAHHRLAGLAAGAFCALLPSTIIWSALFRPYATWMLLAMAHTWAVIRWLDTGGKPRISEWLPVLLTALILPQVHYLSVPWLSLLGLGLVAFMGMSWRRLWVYIPAVVAFLPLLWIFIDPPSTGHLKHQPNPFVSIQQLFEMGLNSRRLFPFSFAPFPIVALFTLLITWRRLESPVRVTLLGSIAIVLTVGIAASQHAMTYSSRLLGVPVLIPLLMALPVILHEWFPKRTILIVVGSALVVVGTARLGVERSSYDLSTNMPSDRTAAFLAEWSEWVPEGNDVGFVFSPDAAVARLVFRDELKGGKPVPTCGDDHDCFIHEGRRWTVADLDALPTDHPLTLVWSRIPISDPLPARCTVVETENTMTALAHCTAVQ